MSTFGSVPVASMLCMAATGLIALLFPLGLFLFANRKWKAPGLPLLAGAGVFVLFALVLEAFVHRLVLGGAAGAVIRANAWLYTLYGGLMAGLFEESGRLCAFLLLRKKYNSLPAALSYGIGHGGCEALLLAGLAMVNNLVISVLINIMGFDGMMRTLGVPAESAAALEAAAHTLASTPPAMFLAGGFERIVAVTFHIAASVLVWLAVSGRGGRWLFLLAIGLHALTNIPAALYQSGFFTNIWLVEALTALIVLGVCVAVYAICKRCLRPAPEDFSPAG